MKSTCMVLIVMLASILAACAAPSTRPIVPTQPPSIPPTQPISVLPTQSPSPLPDQKPTGGLVTKPEADAWKDAPAAALNARADLAQRLSVDPDTISLVSVDHIEWPDGCLGIQEPGVMCIMVITPGYKVVLEAVGKQYEYHTNESGSNVKLATEM